MNKDPSNLLDRRTALLSLATIVAAGCSNRVTVEGLQAALNFDIDLDDTFEAGSPVVELARRIGQIYAERFPAEDDPKTLCQMLFGTDEPPAGHEIKAKTKIRVRDDFDDDDLVFIEGWYLTRSEGRLCCLAMRYGLS